MIYVLATVRRMESLELTVNFSIGCMTRWHLPISSHHRSWAWTDL